MHNSKEYILGEDKVFVDVEGCLRRLDVEVVREH